MWKLQDAKAKFSQLVNNALKIGPQYISRWGKKTVVVISAEEYENLVSPKMPLKDFLLDCPKIESNFDLDRKKDMPRSIDL